MFNSDNLPKIASQVRRDIVRMVTMAGSGHPGGSLSSTDIMTALFFNQMKHSPDEWHRNGKNFDVFYLSAGHLAPVLYSVLARSGYFDKTELGTLRKLGSRLQGHPSVEKRLPGVHTASGSLGQGLSVAIGTALSKRIEGDPNTVFTLLGDGECEEGQVWEAALFAAHHKVDNLIAMVDWNGQQIDGAVKDVLDLGDFKAKWESFGWNCIVSDGHDFGEISKAFNEAKTHLGKGRPIVILFKTEMGRGVDFMAGTHHWHGKAPSQEQCQVALSQLEETLGDF